MKLNLPKIISVFPLSGVIFFPKTNLPLNIFEPRYLALINDCIKSNKYMGMIQTKKDSSEVYSTGCLGKITEIAPTLPTNVDLKLDSGFYNPNSNTGYKIVNGRFYSKIEPLVMKVNKVPQAKRTPR